MNLLKKLTQTKKEQKKDNYFDFFLNSQISNLKSLISDLSTLRRNDQTKLREQKVYQILKELKDISDLYGTFIFCLKNYENQEKHGPIDNLAELEEKILFMQEKKKSLRKDFESVYKNFKRTAMGLEDIPMKSILKKMYTAFDFDGKKYSNPNNTQNENHHPYYDANTMQIRNI